MTDKEREREADDKMDGEQGRGQKVYRQRQSDILHLLCSAQVQAIR